MSLPRVALFAPNPVLTVTLEVEGGGEQPAIHFHAGGQGVWVARMAACLGAEPVLCALAGGETGELLRPLLARAGGTRALVASGAASGCYVTDRRSGEREVIALSLAGAPSRHELDELFSLACAHAISSGWLVVTNPLPPDALPLECYGDLVADARAGGARVLVDLSSPRLDSALRGRPELVKINDWELAEFICGPVSEPPQLLAAAARVRDAGAASVIVTRGEKPALMLAEDEAWQLTPPHFEQGHREGCGDAMMGAIAAGLARGMPLREAAVLGAAAGAANFLRHGLGRASREVVEQLRDAVRVEPWPVAA